MSKIVLDASALLALVNGEKGSDNVFKNLSNAVMSSVNISESATILIKNGVSKKNAQHLLKSLVAEIIDFNEEQAYLAADIYMKTYKVGLSLGDRACLSLAEKLKLPVLTADKAWSKLKLHTKIQLIR